MFCGIITHCYLRLAIGNNCLLSCMEDARQSKTFIVLVEPLAKANKFPRAVTVL